MGGREQRVDQTVIAHLDRPSRGSSQIVRAQTIKQEALVVDAVWWQNDSVSWMCGVVERWQDVYSRQQTGHSDTMSQEIIPCRDDIYG